MTYLSSDDRDYAVQEAEWRELEDIAAHEMRGPVPLRSVEPADFDPLTDERGAGMDWRGFDRDQHADEYQRPDRRSA